MVELEKTAKLIQYYLTLLASEKAQRAADYQPSDWELLTPDEQRARALKRVEIREEERIANLLLWNSVKRDHKAKHRLLLTELRDKRLARMSATSNSSAATTPAAGTTPVAETAANSPNTGRTIQTSTAPYPQPLDRGAANQLEERVNRLKLITIQKKMAPVLVKKQTEATLAENGSTPAVETPATARMTQTAAKTTTSSVEKAPDAMDIDPRASSSSADIQQRPKSPEVRILTKEERIQLLVKEHIVLWKKFEADLPLGASEGNRALLNRAQESQRTLQKLIPRAEVEEYVKGWNPWTAKRDLFPVLQQEGGGKKRSSSSRANFSYKDAKMNDPRRWKKLMKACHTLESGYMNMD
ncbi:uncharacterized protein PGTG_16721 [Puccinia graminis f. sp. tritici CRL 75-36-700-3]|uniref:Uncharacterized protein n=1 Tax=Puccinia graminis f. sp. tritici (strain CRL 75-36-700-3 / race SCCL) TaxID=418459 RepID=E3L2A8_PUCGT|nr:uncharacterized protein PGTG_16721 [Puccinia graminis f. sp. tritici CRL 75-36-700-3]EFP90695.1 hypothetical protein PGTG_16721 [Puccinia graminis f. sp. tritici CRL 75-36-700-3]